jgi:hypothetical protein
MDGMLHGVDEVFSQLPNSEEEFGVYLASAINNSILQLEKTYRKSLATVKTKIRNCKLFLDPYV